MAGAKPLVSLIVSGTKLSSFNGDLLSDPINYRHYWGPTILHNRKTRYNICYKPIVLVYVSTEVIILAGYKEGSALFERHDQRWFVLHSFSP